MKSALITILLGGCLLQVWAQEAGSSVYQDRDAKIREPQINTGVLTGQIEPNKQVQFIESSVLMNVPADAYVAVFGFVQEGQVPATSNATVNARFAEFVKLLKGIGIRPGDVYVDYISQNRVFDYSESGNTITEKLAGFETKKNIAVRYKDPKLLERILAAAGQGTIFDLIEVDYVVADTKAIRARLFDEAVKVFKQKEAMYKALGIVFTAAAVANEKYDVFFPGDRYQAYHAFESGAAYNAYNKTVIRPRKVTTFYYHPVSGEIFDTVINPIGIEPMVQFTLYLRLQGAPDTKK
ncbi:MAG TPA: SIMPL domain-containing protein [Pyrinomonadaceae bacterium]|nr:SIMPL domain-containing protein [Pyrinomonadaceae bacterium]